MARQALASRTGSRVRRAATLGVLASILSIAAYGTAQTLAKSLIDGDTPPQVGSLITFMAGGAVLFFAALPSLHRDLGAPKRSLLWVALAGLLASNGAFLSFFAFARAPVVVISPIIGISPLLTLALAAVFLREVERITLRTAAGSVLVVGGVALVIFGNAA